MQGDASGLGLKRPGMCRPLGGKRMDGRSSPYGVCIVFGRCQRLVTRKMRPRYSRESAGGTECDIAMRTVCPLHCIKRRANPCPFQELLRSVGLFRVNQVRDSLPNPAHGLILTSFKIPSEGVFSSELEVGNSIDVVSTCLGLSWETSAAEV